MRIAILALLLGFYSSLSAQFYTSTTRTGDRFLNWYQDIDTLLFNVEVDTLSAAYTIPFDWSYFGTPVSQYYVSDNGFLTFGSAPAVNPTTPTALPSAAAPNNAIYPFWHDWYMGYDPYIWYPEVINWTEGIPGHRKHYILWEAPWTGMDYWPVGYGFLVVLYECGDFDIMLYAGNSNSAAYGSVGFENATGTDGMDFGASPAMQFPAVYMSPTTSLAITYSQRQAGIDYDLELAALSPSAATEFTDTVTGTVINRGAQAINSFDFHYRQDGGTTHSTTINTTIQPGDTLVIAHPVTWNIQAQPGGVLYLEGWVDNYNGGAVTDQRNCNDIWGDSLEHILTAEALRFSLLEEHVGTWCGFCPDQSNTIEILSLSRRIRVAEHYNDPLDISTPLHTFQNGTPSLTIDRRTHPIGGTAVNGSDILPWMQSSLSIPTYVDVKVYGSYDAGTRQLEADVVAKFVNYVDSAQRRITLLITEDSITGYPQTNYGSGPDPINDYVHQFVLRDHPTGAWGTPGEIPDEPLPGQTYSTHVSYTVPANWDEDQLYLVGVVAQHDDSSKYNRRVENCYRIFMKDIYISTEPEKETAQLMLYPNPARNEVYLEGTAAPGGLKFSLFDLRGRQLHAGDMRHSGRLFQHRIDLQGLDDGMYFIRMEQGNTQITKKVVIRH